MTADREDIFRCLKEELSHLRNTKARRLVIPGEFKRRALLAARESVSLSAAARAIGIYPSQLHQWRESLSVSDLQNSQLKPKRLVVVKEAENRKVLLPTSNSVSDLHFGPVKVSFLNGISIEIQDFSLEQFQKIRSMQ